MNKNRKTLIKEFILNEISIDQISNIFDYIENPLLYDDRYNDVYSDICTVVAENSLDIVDKQTVKVLDYVWISNVFISILNRKQKYDFAKIIQNSSSVILSFMLLHKCYSTIDNASVEKILVENNLKIKNDIETFLRSLYIQQNIILFNICFQAWLFGKEHFEVYSLKKNNLDIKNLNKNEFIILKEKISLVMSFFVKNLDWFKFFVLDIFLHNIESYLELENNKIKNNNITRTIIYIIQVWGLNNLEIGIKRTGNIEILNNLIESKTFIEELAIELKLIDKEKGYSEDFSGYEFIKNNTGFQEPYGSETLPRIINIKGSNIKLLRAEYIKSSDTDNFINKDFLYMQRSLSQLLWQRDIENKLDAYGKKECNEFIILLICNEKEKQILKKNTEKIERRLNSDEKIKQKNFSFKIEIETKENILKQYEK